MCSIIPAVVENHLDSVQCWKDSETGLLVTFKKNGRVVLGSSNLTGRYWNGSLWCFKDVNDAPDVEKCLTGIESSSGICDIICLDETRVVAATDAGTIEVYQLNSEPAQFTNSHSTCEHDDSILSISTNSNKTNMISVGSDKCVKVWNLDTFSTVATFRPVHAGIIWQVSCSTIEPKIFLTCSQDGNILLFDLRLPKPAILIDCAPLQSEPTAVCWKPESLTEFAAGDDSGNVALKDIRKNEGALSVWEAHKRRIFRMAFSPTCKSWLATCADDTYACVTDLEKESQNLIYQDDRHDDFIRGLTWSSDNSLITCGWDKKVLRHVISKMDVAR